MNATNDSLDCVLARLIGQLDCKDYDGAEAELATAQRTFPATIQLDFLEGILRTGQHLPKRAMNAFWSALTLDPAADLIRQHLFDTAIGRLTPIEELAKDFSLSSGERQTAGNIEGIRADHRARYQFAADWLLRNKALPWRLQGVDAFCGNGYGSRIVTDVTGARMIGVDGSQEAIAIADSQFGNHRTAFGCAGFPFRIQSTIFDFGISFESIEHVDDSEGLLRTLSECTNGPLFISVPNESALPFASFKDQFQHHVRHFTRDDVMDILATLGRKKIISEQGQMVYVTHQGRLTGLVPENQMMLRPLSSDSQFFILAFE